MKITAIFFTAIVMVATARAQSLPIVSAENLDWFWVAPIPTESGAYCVAIESITAVSLQYYKMTGTTGPQSVTEMTVETVGGGTAKFLYLEPFVEIPAPVQQASTDFGKKVAQGFSSTAAGSANLSSPLAIPPGKVIEKVFPATTHSKTLEFSLPSKDAVVAMYAQLLKDWTLRGR